MLKIKDGVTPHNLNIAAELANIAEENGLLLVITSGTDGTHMKTSKHYLGDALDVRTSNLTNEQIQMVKLNLMGKLGSDYDVIRESDHIHVEYDPKSLPSGTVKV